MEELSTKHTAEDALKSILTRQVQHELQCDKAKYDMFKAVKLDEAGRKLVYSLKLPQGQRWLVEETSEIYYRPAVHREMWKQVDGLAKGDGLLLMGNPGIGKSCSLNVLLWKALNAPNHDPVLLRDVDGYHFFDPVAGYRRLSPKPGLAKRELQALYGSAGRRIILLHDCKSTATSLKWDIDLYSKVLFSSVLASSPDGENFKEFEKAVVRTTFVYPPWTLKEMQDVFPNISEENFYFAGPVLRSYVLPSGKLRQHLLASIENAISQIHPKSNILDLTVHKESSKFVMLKPTSDYTKFTVDFVSTFAMSKYYERYSAVNYEEFCSVVQRVLGNQMRSGNGGFIYELWVLGLLTEGATYRLNCKDKNGTAVAVDIPSSLNVNWKDRLKSNADVGLVKPLEAGKAALWVPLKSNFPCVDAFLVIGDTLYMIQVTLAADHPLKEVLGVIFSHLDNTWKVASKVKLIVVKDAQSNLPLRTKATGEVATWFKHVQQLMWIAQPNLCHLQLNPTTKMHVFVSGVNKPLNVQVAEAAKSADPSWGNKEAVFNSDQKLWEAKTT